MKGRKRRNVRWNKQERAQISGDVFERVNGRLSVFLDCYYFSSGRTARSKS